MNKQNLNTSEVRTEQAANKKYQTIKLGLDVHADSIVVARILDNSAPQPAQTFWPEKFLDWVKSQVAQAEAVYSWNRFSNRRQMGSYTGLCGGLSASGKTGHLLPITKHGNVRLRTALIELAWRMVFWQKDCKAVQKWRLLFDFPGRLVTKRAARKKAIVAIARQMAVDLWRWRTGKVKAEDLGWVMIGANR